MAKKQNFDPSPFWKYSEIEHIAYKSQLVKKEGNLEYLYVYFYCDPTKTGPNDNIVPIPWLILLNGDDIIAKMIVDDKGRGAAFEVNKKYRRQGYGEKFFKFAIKKYHLNSLQVLSSNRVAIHLYLKLGFKTTKVQTIDGDKYMTMKLEAK